MIALALALPGCRTVEAPRTLEFSGPTMGTTWKLKLVAGSAGIDATERAAIDGAVRDTLTRIEALMSTWDPASELSRFNQSRSTDPFPVSPETYEVFRWAVTLGGETRGALDVTIWPIVEAWGFGASEPAGTAPGADTLARLLETTGTRLLQLDPEGRSVRKRRPEVRCDFSALAPGFAADRVARVLEARGLANFLVDVGGELVARGVNDTGTPWQIAIERPAEGRRTTARLVALKNVAIATSGDYRNYREVDGRRVSHIIDARTGRPIAHRLASATVIDGLGVRADALATALMVLGPDEGMALARRLDLAALLIVRNDGGGFDLRATDRFEALAEGAPDE